MKITYPYAHLIQQFTDERIIINIKEELIVPPSPNIIEALSLKFAEDLQVRGNGIFKNKGIYLHGKYDWVIVVDDEENLVLLQLRKEVEK